MELRVLTWNLMHGRAVPAAGRELLGDFHAALARWDWDAALLQEVPPWWPAVLGRRLDASARLVLTSRNSLLPLRRAIAVRWPDLIKSNGGGSNAILVRSARVTEHRAKRLRMLPERRWLHAVELSSGVLIANLHAGGSVGEALRAADTVRDWARSEPVVLGGDFNLHSPSLPGLLWAGGLAADHVFVRGLEPCGPVAALDRGALSDHAPLLVRLRRAAKPPA
jgi:endonuclease/exonuclease/phosphatase family metal-dependent hydrolase